MRQIKNQNKDIQLMNTENDLFNNSNIDLISIASHDHYHYSHIIKSTKKKKNIFVEKPICTSEKELNSIEKFVKKK